MTASMEKKDEVPPKDSNDHLDKFKKYCNASLEKGLATAKEKVDERFEQTSKATTDLQKVTKDLKAGLVSTDETVKAGFERTYNKLKTLQDDTADLRKELATNKKEAGEDVDLLRKRLDKSKKETVHAAEVLAKELRGKIAKKILPIKDEVVLEDPKIAEHMRQIAEHAIQLKYLSKAQTAVNPRLARLELIDEKLKVINGRIVGRAGIKSWSMAS